ncbi:MAG TPA: DUF1275 family protein [Trebonia sp.]
MPNHKAIPEGGNHEHHDDRPPGDAPGALGRVFVANMTGNVVFAGFAIVGAPGFSLSSSLFALAGFLT